MEDYQKLIVIQLPLIDLSHHAVHSSSTYTVLFWLVGYLHPLQLADFGIC